MLEPSPQLSPQLSPQPSPQVTYQVGGSLPPNSPIYIPRPADESLFQGLLRGDFCYVFSSRQMGKSSLRLRVAARLRQQGVDCALLDLTAIGSQQVTIEQWYAAIAAILSKQLPLQTPLRPWWRERLHLPPAARLGDFIEDVVLPETRNPLVILIDEIDSILALNFPTDDFFALIRTCYNQRAETPDYRRLSFALFGVTSSGDLIADKQRTPFNIGQSIELRGFQPEAIAPLASGLTAILANPHQGLERIFHWTQGQPFLTQKLCQQLIEHYPKFPIPDPDPLNNQNRLIDLCVQQQILEHWEAQDAPEHLKTIRDRLLHNDDRAPELLTLYRQIWQVEGNPSKTPPIPTADSPLQTELLLSGLVECRNGHLQVKNPIYQQVFNLSWIDRHLERLRPYAYLIKAWNESKGQDSSRLLRGAALQEALDWTQRKSLSDLDYRYLSASQELERQERQQKDAFERQTIQQQLEQERLRESQRCLKLQTENVRRQRQFLGVLGLALAGSMALGLATFIAYQRSAVSEVRAFMAASRGSYTSAQQLDALVQGLQARQNLQQLQFLSPRQRQQLDRETQQILEQAIHANHEVNRMAAHRGGVLGVDVSQDGQWIATSGPDGTAKIWRRDGTLVQTLTMGMTIYSVKFSPDSQLLATPSLRGDIYLWSIDGELQTRLRGHEAAVWNLDWSPQGDYLVSASSDGTLRQWSREGQLLHTLRQHEETVWNVAVHPQGDEFASISSDGTIIRWRRDGTLINRFSQGISNGWGIAYHPQGHRLAASYSDNHIRLWQPDGTLLQDLDGHEAEVGTLAFSPDGSRLASGSADGSLKLWSEEGTLLNSLDGHGSRLRGVAFSPDGTQVMSAGEEGLVRIWQVENEFMQPLGNHDHEVWQVRYLPPSSPLGGHLVSLSRGDIRIWNPAGELVQRFEKFALGVLYSLAVHPSQAKIMAGDSRGMMYGIDLASGEINSWSADEFSLFALAYSPDGRWLVSGGNSTHLKIWRPLAEGGYGLHQVLEGHQARVWDLGFSPDGSYLTSASIDGTVRLWEWDSQHRGDLSEVVETPPTILTGDYSPFWGLSISPESDRILSAGRSGVLNLWNRQGEQLLKRQVTETSGLTRVAWSPDGQVLAVARTDHRVDLYREDGLLMGQLRNHQGTVLTLDFSPDGRYLVSGGEDRRVVRWDMEEVYSLDGLKYGCRRVKDYLRQQSELEPLFAQCQFQR
ncbi:AAA-like domain-containing protein [Sodalinema gerasimenkoae]|uniref:AAA-like domain-containing protein n=1 Tax=Sodalinema gerasimenkoae TaxID=2862348 RepID=UPI001358237A|nr:AAA-like domain-containing protein [Sodalinema gerasimenkoae]